MQAESLTMIRAQSRATKSNGRVTGKAGCNDDRGQVELAWAGVAIRSRSVGSIEEGKIKWAVVGKRRNGWTRREDGRLELDQPARMMVAMLDSSKTKRHAAGHGQPTCGVKRAVVEEKLQGYA
jgi:hypothetical protein